MKLRRSTCGPRERASATVEFALVLPLVLTMTLALLQIGLFVKDELVVQEAARAGARQAAVSADDGAAQRAALDASPSLDPDRIEVSVQREGGVGTGATVTVLYHAPVVVPIVSWLFRSTVDLSAKAIMRQETG
jgi:hypothetical protein